MLTKIGNKKKKHLNPTSKFEGKTRHKLVGRPTPPCFFRALNETCQQEGTSSAQLDKKSGLNRSARLIGPVLPHLPLDATKL